MTAPDSVEMEIESIRKSRIHGTNVVVLQAKDGQVVLPIWIGGFEAEAIAMILEQRPPHRPITHDLSLQMVAVLGAQVQRVVISRLVEGTFYAEVELMIDGQTKQIDARPSDAIALAVRVGAPIFVERAVLDSAGAPSADEWTQKFTPELAGQGPLARSEPVEQTWMLGLTSGAEANQQRTITLAQFTSADWPSPAYQRETEWDGRRMLAIRLPTADEQSPWLVVSPDFWERQALTIIRAGDPPATPDA